MNKVYKLIWCVSRNVWVVCSELGRVAKSQNGKVSVVVAVLVALVSTQTVFATVCTSLNGWGGRGLRYL